MIPAPKAQRRAPTWRWRSGAWRTHERIRLVGVQIIDGAGKWTSPGDAPNDWVEHLRVPDLSVGTYCIPAGGEDTPSPHTEDEIYVVTAGRATVVTPSARADVGPGAVIFVPAGEEHRFVDVTQDLALLVVFGPAYGTRTLGQ